MKWDGFFLGFQKRFISCRPRISIWQIPLSNFQCLEIIYKVRYITFHFYYKLLFDIIEDII